LKPLIGRTVEIIVLSVAPAIGPGTGDWDAAARVASDLDDYDFDAWREQRDFDRQRAAEHLP
jgi:hypothetical protein